MSSHPGRWSLNKLGATDQRVAVREEALPVQRYQHDRLQKRQGGKNNMTAQESRTSFPRDLMTQIPKDHSPFHDNMWTFFEQERFIGRHTIPKDGRQALENLANSQKRLAQPEFVELPLYLFEEPPLVKQPQ